MKQSTIAALVITLSMSLVGLSGCSTMRITVNSKVPAEITGRLPYAIGLYFTPEFETYRWRGPAAMELSWLDYDLGSASKSLFIETSMRLARLTLLVQRKPPYSGPDEPAVAIVIDPRIVGFGEEHSAFLRIADYTAHIEYRAIVYDRAGAVLLDKIYRGDGETQGTQTPTPSQDSNFLAPAAIAMSRAIAALVKDVSRLPVAP